MEYVNEDLYAHGEGAYSLLSERGKEAYILLEPPRYDELPIDGKHKTPVFYGKAIRIGNPVYMEEDEEETGSTKAYALVWVIVHEGEVEADDACDMAHPAAAIPLGGGNYFFNIYTEEFYAKGGISLELH